MDAFYKTLLQVQPRKPVSIASPDLEPVTSTQTLVQLPIIPWPSTLGTTAYPIGLL